MVVGGQIMLIKLLIASPQIFRLSYGPVFMACILSWGLLPTFSSQQARPSLLKFYAGFQAIENLSGVREMGGWNIEYL